jgi:hypothetical protein
MPLLDLGLDRDQLGELFGSDATAGLAGDVAGSDGREHGLGLPGGDVALGLPGKDFGAAGLEERITRAAGELAAVISKTGDRITSISSRHRGAEDELTDPTPFELLLEQAKAG